MTKVSDNVLSISPTPECEKAKSVLRKAGVDLSTVIETYSQPQLLVMLFDAAAKKLRIARKAIEENNIETPHNELIKVQRIFSELMVALDFEVGGELAQQLFSIYDFVYRQLVRANIQRDVKIIDEVLPIVEDLRKGWAKAIARQEEENNNHRC